jgi:hypothetical protein
VKRTLDSKRRRASGPRLALVALAAMGQICAAGRASGQGTSSEYAVKAAFLFHFAQFVEWPAAAFREASSPYVYCTVGLDPFRGVLETTLRDKVVGGRGFEVRHLKQLQEAQDCHLVFVGEEQKRQIGQAVAGLRGRPVLLVGESEHFVDEGGMIGFLLEDNKVRFEVNLEATEKAGLKVSAKLLALAKTVKGAPKRS